MPTTPDLLPDFLISPSAMLFNSPEYLLLFLPLVVCGYFRLNRYESDLLGKLLLVFASLFFYGWWSINYLWLIGTSILFNFLCAHILVRRHQLSMAKYTLGIAIGGNLLLLSYYKYADFFITNYNQWLQTQLPLLHLALPLGISFFTFTQIAFLVDVYRGKAREYNFIHYILFVTYFPHLIAGPILHHSEMMPQFAERKAKQVNWGNILAGLFILAIGLLKKVWLADSLAIGANIGFDSTQPVSFLQAWLSSLSYTLQLYFDFSGYCDMAIGASLLLNIRLPENFNSPYKALTIREFWQRWHITLSRWLRDYLYIPLGGNKHGELRMYIALLLTFILGGLWHGASWTFIIWGCLHGIASIIYKLWQHTSWHLPRSLAWLATFLFASLAWVFFRAPTIAAATQMFTSLSGLHGLPTTKEFKEIIGQLQEWDFWNPLADVGSFPTRQFLVLLLGFLLIILPNTATLSDRLITMKQQVPIIFIASSTIGLALFCTLFLSTGLTPYIYFYF